MLNSTSRSRSTRANNSGDKADINSNNRTSNKRSPSA